MTIIRLFFLSSIILFSINASSQKNIRLVGKVSEMISHEPIINALVLNGENYVETNLNGIFVLTLDSLPTTVFISRIGFKDTSIVLHELPVLPVTYQLSPSSTLNEIIIKDKYSGRYFENGNYLIDKISKSPGVLGERDIQRTLQMLPGINAGEEGDTKLNVRGGSDDQNLYLLDGCRIFNPSHIGGYVSTFNIDAVRDFQIYKGNIPSEYGNFTSSVIQVTSKDGSQERLNYKLQLGLISSTFSIDGPLLNSKLKFSFSGRTSLIGLLSNTFLKNNYKKGKTDDVIAYNLQDLNGKLSFKINERSQLFLTAYGGKDGYFYGERRGIATNAFTTSESDGNWQNKALTLGYFHTSAKGFFKSTVGISSYSLENLSEETTTENNSILSKFQNNISSSIKEIRNINTYSFNIGKIKSKIGIENTISLNAPTKFNSNIQPSSSSDIHLITSAVFSDFGYSFSEKISATIGGRFVAFNSNKYNDISLEPRMNINYRVAEKANISLSYSKLSQTYHKLLSSGLLALNDVWLLADESRPIQKSEIFDLMFTQQLSPTWRFFSVGLYYKNLNNLIHYQSITTSDNLLTPDWENNIYTDGTGKAYGLEISSLFELKRFSLDLNYTYSRSFRLFKDLNDGDKFPFAYDRPHNFNISTQFKINSKWQFSAQFLYYSGRRVTLPVGYVFDNPILPSYTYFVFDDINNGHLPSFHRLDIAFNRTIKKNNIERTFSVGCYNIYNRKNATSYRINVVKEENPIDPDRPVKIKEVKTEITSFFPILPYISYGIKF